MPKDRNDYLNKSADIVCKAVYDACRGMKKDGGADAKGLKELCGVLKEAIGISAALEKTDGGEAGLLVTFDDAVRPFVE